MKRIALLGCTGSIGKRVLEAVDRYPEEYKIVSLCCGKNAKLLGEQIRKYKPEVAGLYDPENVFEAGVLPAETVLYTGEHAMEHCVTLSADLVFVAVVGFCGLKGVLCALENKKNVALANKEALVAGGELVTSLAEKNGCEIIPVDSEHSAIWQALGFDRRAEFKKLIITASGGALRDVLLDKLKYAKAADALKHPNWQMGAKITIDCATMFNKGLEVIEASRLFCCGSDKIEVLIHPESAVHSMVVFNDNGVMAQIARPSMALPVQLALSYPERKPCAVEEFDFTSGALHFSKPDLKRYPCFSLALDALEAGGVMPCAASGANEQAVELFLRGAIGFTDIEYYIKSAMDACENASLTYENLARTDYVARQTVLRKFKEKTI